MTLYDDTEDSVVGSEWHQFARALLVSSLYIYALDAALPWHVGNQLTLVGPGTGTTPWRPMPDFSVHATAGPALREELDIRAEGPPRLALEVVSSTTWEYDTDLREGKAWGYLELCQIPEYLVFDPQGSFVVEQCRGWRRHGSRIEPWQPGASGRYESSLDVSFAVEGTFLRVYDPQGQALPFDFELRAQLREERARHLASEERAHGAEIAQRAAEQRAEDMAQRLAALEEEMRRLRGEH